MERTLAASNSAGLPIIALVPGVGRVRPSRAWPLERWRELIKALLERNSHFPVIIGGADDQEEGERLDQEFQGQIVNLCGKLALEETATFLSQCDLVISGDTGPAHIAVAVGTTVVGLYGPTLSGRSGPYGCEKLIITKEQSCRCQTEKVCRFAGSGSSGECISSITAAQVLEKIDQAMSPSNMGGT